MRFCPGAAWRLGLSLLFFAGPMEACSPPLGHGSLDVHPLTLSLPELPPSWAAAGGLMFHIEWRDGEGVLQGTLAPPGSSLEVELARGVAQEVLAVAFVQGRELRPAGARYPADLDSGPDGGLGKARLPLGWKGGWLASLSRRLASGGYDPESFNLAHLKAVLDAADMDPWLLEPGEAARRLIAGTFRSSLLSEAKRFAVGLPGTGPWLAESALAPQPRHAADGSWTVDLPEGLSLVLGEDVALAIRVDSTGKSVIVRLP